MCPRTEIIFLRGGSAELVRLCKRAAVPEILRNTASDIFSLAVYFCFLSKEAPASSETSVSAFQAARFKILMLKKLNVKI